VSSPAAVADRRGGFTFPRRFSAVVSSGWGQEADLRTSCLRDERELMAPAAAGSGPTVVRSLLG